MASEQVFRIEIPVEATNETDMQQFEKLEKLIEKLFNNIKQGKSSAEDMLDGMESMAEGASSAFRQSTQEVDKFSQRVEKSQKTLKSAFAEKIKLTIAAIDQATPIIKSVFNSAKSMLGKAWNVTVKMVDFVTAPFRKLYNMITSPVTLALSIAGIGTSASDMMNVYSNFSSGMSNVKAISGATEAEFRKLSATAKELGSTTAFTAAQASEGMQYLAMAGWNTNQIIAAMPGLLDLAAAGGTELGTAADIVSDVMTAMGMSAEEASHAADVFARTATSTNTTIEGLGSTMKYAASIAHTYGLSLEEVSAAAGLMANAGIKGEMAGTALRASLLRMARPTSDMLETMQLLGLSFTDDSGAMLHMSDTIRMLEQAFKGLSDSEKLTYAQSLFGTEAASAWLGVINQGADAYDALADSLENADGAASNMANTRLDNLAGDLTILGSAAEGLELALMEKLSPYLRQGVQWLTSKIPEIQTALTNGIDKVFAKAREVKETLTSFFGSDDFLNAGSFADKMFLAWDKLIAEPFAGWWDSDGRDFILSKVADIGRNFGEVVHGIVAGISAALKGEEIDFEGINITGVAKAAAEIAKTFADSFINSLDVGGLFNGLPGILKAVLLGTGAVKLGSGVAGLAKNVSMLKIAFGGVGAAAAGAEVATATVGTAAAGTAASVGTTVGVLGTLKTALASVPVWGWVAAAAVTAATVGISAYNKEQEKRREELLHLGEAAQEHIREFRAEADEINHITDNIKTMQAVTITGSYVGPDKSELMDVQTALAVFESRQAQLEYNLSMGGTEEQMAAWKEELDNINAAIAADEVRLQEFQGYVNTVVGLVEELNSVSAADIEITIEPKGYVKTSTYIQSINAQMNFIDGKTAEVNATMNTSALTPETIATYVDTLNANKIREIEIEAILSNTNATETQIEEWKAELYRDKMLEAELAVKLGDGTATEKDLRDYVAIQQKIAHLDMLVSVPETSQKELDDLKEELAALKSQDNEIYVDMAANGMSEKQIADVTDDIEALAKAQVTINMLVKSANALNNVTVVRKRVTDLDGLTVKIAAVLNKSTLTEKEINAYVDELNAIDAKKVEIGAALNTIEFDADLNDLKNSLDGIVEKRREILLSMSGDGMSTEKVGQLVSDLTSIAEAKVEVHAQLKGFGLTTVGIQLIEMQMEDVDGMEADVYAVLGESSLTPEDITSYVNELKTNSTRIVEIETMLSGADATEREIETWRKDLYTRKQNIAEIELKMADGTATQKEIEQYVTDRQEAAKIELMLKTSEASKEEIAALDVELAGLRDRNNEIYVKMAENGMKEDAIKAVKDNIAGITSVEAGVDIILSGYGLTATRIKAVKTSMHQIDGMTADVKTKFADDSLTGDDVNAKIDELQELITKQLEIQMQIDQVTNAQNTIDALNDELDELNTREAKILVKLSESGLEEDDIALLKQSLNEISLKKIELTATLKGYGLSVIMIQSLQTMVDGIHGKEVEVKATLAKGGISQDDIDAYVAQLEANSTRRYELEMQLTGAAKTYTEVAELKTKLQHYKMLVAEMQIKMADGTATESEVKQFTEAQQEIAKIKLILSGVGLDPETVGALDEELLRLNDEDHAIYVKMAKGGMSEADIAAVAKDINSIGSQTAFIHVVLDAVNEGKEGAEEAAKEAADEYAAWLNEKFNLGITGDQLLNHKDPEQNLDLLRNTKLIELGAIKSEAYDDINRADASQREIEAEQRKVAEMSSELEQLQASRLASSDLRASLSYWETAYKKNQREMDWSDFEEWQDEYYQGLYDALFKYMKSRAGSGYTEEQFQTQTWFMYENSGFDTAHEAILNDFFGEEKSSVASYEKAEIEALQSKIDSANAKIQQHYDSLNRAYENLAYVIMNEAMLDTSMYGKNPTEMAMSFGSMTTEEMEAYAKALTALSEFNTSDASSFVDDSVKMSTADMMDLAARSALLDEMKGLAAAITDKYGNATEISGADMEAAVDNLEAALTMLGQGREIENVQDMAEAIDTIMKADPTQFSLESVRNAFIRLQADVSTATDKINTLKAAIQTVSGLSLNIAVPTPTGGVSFANRFGFNANGGIYDGAFLSWVAEDGPEAIIPLSTSKRDRGLDLWFAAGDALGVSGFAAGGIVAPYAGLVSGGDESYDGYSIGGGGNTVTVTVSANPTYQINGGENPEQMMETIRTHQTELAEILGSAIADQLEDIISNMV